jgi:hypothetical protein
MLNRKTGLIALLAGAAASGAFAQTLTNYTSGGGDVLLCFRNSADMVIDAGPISTLTALAPNTRYPITTYSVSQLSSIGGIDGASWSAFTWLGNNTLYMSSPRGTVGVQTPPWTEASSASQGLVASRMAEIPTGAASSYDLHVYGASTPSAVIEQNTSVGNPNYPPGGGVSYFDAVSGSYGGDFNGDFEGNPENTTSGSFSTDGTVQQSDFYALSTHSGYSTVYGTWLGYFELAPSGAVTYVAYPSTPAVISSVSRLGNTTTINYTTGLYGTYTLRATNNLVGGALPTTWPAVTTLSHGDTASHIVTDTDNVNTVKFYTITAQ